MQRVMLSEKPTAVLDACVLYPEHLRDFLLRLASAEAYLPFWTEQIRDEWTRNLLENRTDISPERLGRVRRNMNFHFPTALVQGYEPLISTLSLPHLMDRHVLAAAIHAKAECIITFNLDDFPESILQHHKIEALSPDEFVSRLIRKHPNRVIVGARNHRQGLTRPAMSPSEYTEMLENQGLAMSVAFL